MSHKIQCPRCQTVLVLGGVRVKRGIHIPCPGCAVQMWVEPDPPSRKRALLPVSEEEDPASAAVPWVIGTSLAVAFVFVVIAIVFTVIFIQFIGPGDLPAPTSSRTAPHLPVPALRPVMNEP